MFLDQSIALIVPTYNEAPVIRAHLERHSNRFDFTEIVVVDGGSTDGTRREIRSADAEVKLITKSPGNRSRQLKEGVRVSKSRYLIFLHADTYLPENFDLERLCDSDHRWGWFDCQLDDSSTPYRILGNFISWRSALFSSPTGDQGIWVERSLLDQAGGIPEIPLMEDVEISQRLRRFETGNRFRKPVTTSSRRWKDNGLLKTILSMWTLKVAYYLGVPPKFLAQIYYGRTET